MASGYQPTRNDLINETDVLGFFMQNGGIVRNNDIVTHFRSYLANPAIRDEARASFKSIVNKLATVKVENGEKFLVLKRKFFPPIDGNGNNNTDGGLGSQGAVFGTQASYQPRLQPLSSTAGNTHLPPRAVPAQPANSFPYQGYEYNQNVRSTPPQQHSAPVVSSNPYDINPYSHQVPPTYIPQQQQYASVPQQQYYQHSSPSQLSKSQPNIYGSNFSIVSNTSSVPGVIPGQNSNSYLTSSQSYQQQIASASSLQQNKNENYPPEYGLPTLPPSMNTSPQRRLSFTASPSTSSLSTLGLPQQQLYDRQGNGRTPPPYRPPPPALGSQTPPSSGPPGARMTSPPNSYYRNTSPATGNLAMQQQVRRQLNLQQGPDVNSQGGRQYQRSLSGPENITSPGSGNSGSVCLKSGIVSSPSSINPSTSTQVASTAFLQAATTTASSVPGLHPSSGEFVPAPPVPPRFKRGSSSGNSPNSETGLTRHAPTMNADQNLENGAERDSDFSNDKENTIPVMDENQARSRSLSLPNGNDGTVNASGDMNECPENASEESDQKISVKERMQKFNRIASESELGKLKSSNNVNKGKQAVPDQQDYDSASLSSYGYGYANTEPRAREWILKAATCDYHGINKLGIEVPSLVRRKDVNGYTALHWAAKHGHVELIKLIAGSFKADVNSKSNGGYTPLHLAAQFSRHDAYEILVKVYNADPNIRDHSGRKPMQYLVRQDTTVSMDTFKKIKDKRRSTESQRDSSFLRMGSLNVRVKRTTEAFGNFLGKSNSSSSIERMTNKSWGSADNIQESVDNNGETDKDKEMMPPPPNGNIILRGSSKSSKDKSNRSRRSVQTNDSSPMKLQLASSSDSEESDSACGFGSDWKS